MVHRAPGLSGDCWKDGMGGSWLLWPLSRPQLDGARAWGRGPGLGQGARPGVGGQAWGGPTARLLGPAHPALPSLVCQELG